MNNIPKNVKRLNQLIKILEDRGSANIPDLSKYFKVSEMTIYNDLKKLGNDNRIFVVKRGAIFKDNRDLIGIDLSHYDRFNRNKEEKKIIAKKALKCINNYDSIFLDGSTTIQYLAKLLAEKSDLHLNVITISPIIAIELAKNKNIEILCTGGVLNKTHYVYFDNYEKLIEGVNINKAFMSCLGFSVENGFTEQINEEAELKSKIKKYCENIYVLLDHTKFNKIGAYTFGPVSFAKKIITNDLVDKRLIELIKKHKVDII